MNESIPGQTFNPLLDADGSGKLIPGIPAQSKPGQISPAQFEVYYTRYKDADALIKSQQSQITTLQEQLAAAVEAVTFYRNAYDPPEGFSHDCFTTGPLTGNPIADYVACPGCVAFNAASDILKDLSTTTQAHKEKIISEATQAERERIVAIIDQNIKDARPSEGMGHQPFLIHRVEILEDLRAALDLPSQPVEEG